MTVETRAKSGTRALILGVEPKAEETIKNILDQTELIVSPFDLEALMQSPIDPAPFVILCGNPPEGVSQAEVAQTLRMTYPQAAIFLVTSLRQGFDRKTFVKNGLTDAFLLPVDRDELKTSLQKLLSHATQGKAVTYQPVKLVDISAGIVMDFDTFLYMPANHKHIRFNCAGDPIDAERVERLKKHQVNNLYVPRSQIQKFYDFTAAQLRALGSDKKISETERKERMQSAVRSLLVDLYNDSSRDSSTTHGKALMNNCEQIVKSYITLGDSAQGSWYQKILTATSAGGSNYAHSSNVATFAALFSLALNIGKPEDLAIAGILHDIGIADVVEDFHGKPQSEWTAEELAAYQTHIEKTQTIIRNRKLILSNTVLKVIEQHHERCDGSGYPRQLLGSRISPEAKLFAIADEIDEQTAARQDQIGFNPFVIIVEMQEKASKNPAASPFDFEILNLLLKLFAPANQEISEKAG